MSWNAMKSDLRRESLKTLMRKVNDIKILLLNLLSNFVLK